MLRLASLWRRVLHGDEGQDLGEYALLLALITLALLLAVYALRTPILNLFNSASNVLQIAVG